MRPNIVVLIMEGLRKMFRYKNETGFFMKVYSPDKIPHVYQIHGKKFAGMMIEGYDKSLLYATPLGLLKLSQPAAIIGEPNSEEINDCYECAYRIRQGDCSVRLTEYDLKRAHIS